MKRGLRFWIPILVIMMVMVLAATCSDTGQPLGKGGKHKTPVPTGLCSVVPNPTPQWALNTISGSGFAPSIVVSYSIEGSGGIALALAGTDATGSFSTISQGVWVGTNTVKVSGGGVLAICVFQVV